MKKRMTVLSVVCVLAFVFVLTGCNAYVSNYVATGWTKNTFNNSNTIAFSSFEGNKSFSLNAGDNCSTLEYTAKIGSGSVTVYYEDGGEKIKLYSLTGDDEVSSSVELSGGRNINFIMETEEKCTDGEFTFDFV